MQSSKRAVNLTVLVASLGYFVDIYDLQLFNIVSKQSLMGIGITDPELIKTYDYTFVLVANGRHVSWWTSLGNYWR